jgi:hypothetical protein
MLLGNLRIVTVEVSVLVVEESFRENTIEHTFYLIYKSMELSIFKLMW